MSRSMKDSGVAWIGEIPETWSDALLSSILDERKNKNKGMQEDNLLSLSYGNIVRKNINTNDGLLPASFEGYNIVESGDIVLRLTDLQNDHRSLRTGLCKERGIITSAYTTLKQESNKHDSRYLHYYLHCFDLCKGFYGMGDGVRQGLSYDGIRKIPMLIPREGEEKVIADFIDSQIGKVDTLISNQQKQIEKLKQYKQSLITEVVTKGLNPDVEMKDSDVEWIEKIPIGWSVRTLKGAFSFSKGLPITKADLVEKGTAVISYGQIHAKYNCSVHVDERLLRYVPDTFAETHPQCFVKKEDFIFADTSEDVAGSGDFVYIDTDEPIFAGYHTIVLKPKKEQKNRYLAYLFMSDMWKKQIQCRVSGVKLFSISRSILGKVTYILPTESEQNEIADFLEGKCKQIDRLISIKQQKIEKLNQYKKSIIYEYVTGKKEA